MGFDSRGFSLSERTALITGSSQGIGWGIAQALAQAGAAVVLNGRNEQRLAARVAELEERGRQASYQAFDVTDFEQAVSVIGRFARLDILVINAATVWRGPSLDVSQSEWSRVIDADLKTPFMLAQAALRQMLPRRSGRIIMVSSVFDRLARPQMAAYVAAKGGISALVRALAVEFGGRGVTVNAIAPGYVRTPATETIYNDPDFHARICARIPLARWAEPEDVGGAAVFLASDTAAYVNGTVITVDGGLTARL